MAGIELSRRSREPDAPARVVTQRGGMGAAHSVEIYIDEHDDPLWTNAMGWPDLGVAVRQWTATSAKRWEMSAR